MVWTKLGRLYKPAASHPQLITHAANPVAIHLDEDVYRIYFSGRDQENRSSVSFVDIDILSKAVVRENVEPVFTFGPENSFYSHGVSIGSTYSAGGQRYILFMGWHQPTSGHWCGQIGRLHVGPHGSLTLVEPTPVLPLSEEDPLSLSYPWVTERKSGGYHMWYGSTLDWSSENGEMVHAIKHAESADGEQWLSTGVAIPIAIGVAQAFSRPTVLINSESLYEMWFSYRSGTGETYRLGYATSTDGSNWQLALDQTGLTVSNSGWDSEMIEYPFVFQHKGRDYLLYNGNGYGKSGFGIAVRSTSGGQK